MIVSWPWGSADEWPDFDAFRPEVTPDLTVYDDDPEPGLVDRHGAPLRPRRPVGFALPERA